MIEEKGIHGVLALSAVSPVQRKMGKTDENNAKLKKPNYFLRNIISRDSKNTGDNKNKHPLIS